MTPPAGSPGTASDHYRTTPADHPWRAATTDPGERPRCTHCGQERHLPTQRDGRRDR